MARNDRHVRSDEVVALFVGGDWDRKGLALAIEGVAEARRLGTQMRLWVVGSGEIDRFHRFAVEQGIVGEVDFLGQHDEPARWYQGADIFLCCSQYETFSLATVEAAASGLPVVTTAVGVASDIVYGQEKTLEVGGVIVERDAIRIGRELADLAVDAGRRQILGATAQNERSASDGIYSPTGWTTSTRISSSRRPAGESPLEGIGVDQNCRCGAHERARGLSGLWRANFSRETVGTKCPPDRT